MATTPPPPKNCRVCGRTMEWRKKWEKTWDTVKYCGEKCRRSKQTLENDYETKILALLRRRASNLTICPSEILPEDLKSNPLEMENARQAARRLVHAEQIEILQKGKVIDPSAFRGPIRLRLKK